ncbi:MAG: hypothetical protein NVSMB25_10340 [Thermoleophilaceae bacterium]
MRFCKPIRIRRIPVIAGSLALIAAVVLGLSQTGGGGSTSPLKPPSPALLAGSPPPLASLHSEAGRLLEGQAPAFRQRLVSLRGYPIVVNKWASWCGPCRAEFPLFGQLAVTEGRRVAFLGVNSGDVDAEARRFLQAHPVSYPSYRDPDLKVAQVFSGVAAFPTTAFYDARGKLRYIHQGAYASEAKLRADIRRYAGDGDGR